MKKRYLLLLFLASITLGIVAYNYWSYCNGRCSSESLLTVSLPAQVLIGINLLGLVLLLLVTLWRRSATDPHRCACGEQLHSGWQFCPCCGQSRLKTN